MFIDRFMQLKWFTQFTFPIADAMQQYSIDVIFVVTAMGDSSIFYLYLLSKFYNTIDSLVYNTKLLNNSQT